MVQLAHGVARIQLLAGPEVIVEAPAEVSIVDDHGIYVHQGRVSATAEGRITLQTALAAVEGEDSECSAVVEPDQPLQVFCHRGDIRVVSLRPGESRPAVLRELGPSEGAEFYWAPDASSSKVVSIEHPGDIVRDWSQVTDRFHPYEQVVLGDRPVAYWPLMHVRRNRRVLDLTQHGFDGQSVGAWPSESKAVALTQERGAYFDGGCYIEPDTKPRVDLTNGFTIEGWANVTGGPEYQSVFTSRWVLGAGTSTQQCFGFTLYAGADDRWQFWSGSGEYGAGWQALTSDEPLERHRWTHVAARFRPLREAEGQWVEGAVELYVDGELAAEGVHRMSLIDFEWPARIGAAEFVPKSLTSWLFQGELRDIALYDYPLDDTQLQAHHKRGRGAT
ncbi:LamG domain-containing protein [Posidoniimonas corsicana]|uniref:LamG domain-containing protein n=1 Tax=Posidoniimonas corsicana TaxID=1938618 RepID=UPI0018D30EE7|nr:LamG domain-containing protein [Posidoniimonas corsicana]